MNRLSKEDAYTDRFVIFSMVMKHYRLFKEVTHGLTNEHLYIIIRCSMIIRNKEVTHRLATVCDDHFNVLHLVDMAIIRLDE